MKTSDQCPVVLTPHSNTYSFLGKVSFFSILLAKTLVSISSENDLSLLCLAASSLICFTLQTSQ